MIMSKYISMSILNNLHLEYLATSLIDIFDPAYITSIIMAFKPQI